MSRKYQVFISSTFVDLEDVRGYVSEALLRADCLPAGMELFPAADKSQLEYIYQVIDQSDYYVIISAGMYGSIDKSSGKSYTELEYDYAVARGVPIIRLLHSDPFNKLHGDKIESRDAGRKKLKEFREKLKKDKLVAFWDHPKDLGERVLNGLRKAQETTPRPGWVRGDSRAVRDEALGALDKHILDLTESSTSSDNDIHDSVVARQFSQIPSRTNISGEWTAVFLEQDTGTDPYQHTEKLLVRQKNNRFYAVYESLESDHPDDWKRPSVFLSDGYVLESTIIGSYAIEGRVIAQATGAYQLILRKSNDWAEGFCIWHDEENTVCSSGHIWVRNDSPDYDMYCAQAKLTLSKGARYMKF